MAERRSAAWAGWVAFAGLMLLVNGFINGIEGIIAVFSSDRVVAAPDNFVVVDLTGWGVFLLVAGTLLAIVGVGLLTAQSWARYTAIVLVSIHAGAQVLWLGAYPLWAR